MTDQNNNFTIRINASDLSSNVVSFDNINLIDRRRFTLGYRCGTMSAGVVLRLCVAPPVKFNSTIDASGDGTMTYQWQSSTDATPAVTITGDNIICEGNMVTFTANPIAGGVNPAYQWKLNGVDISGATNSTYTSNTFVNGDKVSVVLTSTLTCLTAKTATSAETTISVNANATPTVIVSSNLANNVACGDGTLAIFTASPLAGGNAPTYQWKVNGTDVAFTVVTKDVPTVTIAAGKTTISQGESVTFAATPVKGNSNNDKQRILYNDCPGYFRCYNNGSST